MKVKKEGKAASSNLVWWDGKTVTCDKCGAQVELESTDRVIEYVHPHAASTFAIACPTMGCGAMVDVPKK